MVIIYLYVQAVDIGLSLVYRTETTSILKSNKAHGPSQILIVLEAGCLTFYRYFDKYNTYIRV